MSDAIEAAPLRDDLRHELSVAERVEEIVRERIIRGHYPQGSRITEANLASELDVSRLPLRAALPRLKIDGFVTNLGPRSNAVFTWTQTDVENLFDARLAIEVAAAGYAARRVAVEQTDTSRMREAIAESHAALDRGDRYVIAETNAAVHQRIVEVAGNDMIEGAMRTIAGRVSWMFYLSRTRDTHIACEQHYEICDAIEAGNEGLARSLAFLHIESGRAPTLRAMGFPVGSAGGTAEHPHGLWI